MNEGQKAIDNATLLLRNDSSVETVPFTRYQVWEIDWLVKQLKKDLWRKGSDLCMAVSDRYRDREHHALQMQKARRLVSLGREAFNDPDLIADFEEQAREFLGLDDD